MNVGGGTGGKIPVVGMIEREGNVIAKVIPNTSYVQLIPFVKENASEGAIVMTDEHKAYMCLAESLTIEK